MSGSDILDLIRDREAEQARIRNGIAHIFDEERRKEERARVHALAVEIDALWDARRRELVGLDYYHALGYGNSATRGCVLMGARHGRAV